MAGECGCVVEWMRGCMSEAGEVCVCLCTVGELGSSEYVGVAKCVDFVLGLRFGISSNVLPYSIPCIGREHS